MLRTVALGGALAVTGATAAADPVPDIYPDLELPDRSGLPETSLHLEGGAGVDFGYISAGTDVGLVGLHGLLGLRANRIAVLAELDGALVGDRQFHDESGLYGRVAVEARLSLWQHKVREQRRHARFASIVRADVWIEPGIGYEWANQLTGTTLERRDVSLAIGYQTTQHDGGFYNGSYIALRIIEARAPATPYDSGADTSILVTSGVLFGK